MQPEARTSPTFLGPAAWLLAAVFLVAIVGTALPTRIPEIRLLATIVGASALGLWLVLWRSDHVDWLLIAAIASGLLALAATSLLGRDPSASRESVAIALGYGLLFLAVHEAGRHERNRTAIARGVLLGLTAWLVVLAAAWVTERIAWVAAGGGWPVAASFTTLVWDSTNVPPFLVLLGAGFLPLLKASTTDQVLRLMFIVASVVVVALSDGRAAWLGLLVAGALYLGTSRRSVFRNRIALTKPRVLAAVTGVVAIVFAMAMVSGQLDSRITIWSQAISIFLDSPLAGAGPNTFSWVRLEHVEPYANPTITEHAHSLVLQTAADGGLMLLIAVGFIAAAYASRLHQRRHAITKAQFAGLCVLAGFIVGSLLDHLTAFNAIIGLAIGLAALSLPPAQVTGPSPQTYRVRIAIIAVTASFMVLSLPTAISVGLGRLEARQAREELLTGHPEKAASAFEEALKMAPTNAAYHMGWALSRFALGDEAAATKGFRRAVQLSPGDPRPLGALAFLTRDDDEVGSLLEAASVRSAGDAQYPARFAKWLESRGHVTQALRQYAIAVMLYPPAILDISDVSGHTTPEAIRNAIPRVIAELGSRARVSEQLVEDELSLVVDGAPSPESPAWQAVWLAQRGRSAEAHSALARTERDSPHAQATWAGHAAVGELECDEALQAQGIRLLSLLRERFRVAGDSWDPVYREQGLGDYQWAWDRLIERHDPSPLWATESQSCRVP